ncbi:MAG: hypothetical protein K8R36_24355 [Planctomycetales bacterium]|nr:hypothetical protein [Planctomycetales bacterium]
MEIPVVCNVCGTRMYAKESQIGESLRCPDCYTQVEVKAPKVGPPPTKKKTLDEMEEFQLSDPGERPTYQPMVETRGEYAELQLLDTKAAPRKEPARPGEVAASAPKSDTVDPMMNETMFPGPAAGPPPHRTTAVAHAEDDLDDQEVVLSAPVERIETKTEIKVPNLPPPPKDERKEPTWNDDEWGFIADPRALGSWKKSPFYIGILTIFTDTQVLLRVAAYSIGLTAVLSFLGNASILADSGEKLWAVITFVFFAVTAALVSISFSPVLLAIATDTANGDDKVQSWPDWSVTEWIFTALYIPIAAALAVLPGGIMSSMFLAVGEGAQWFAPFPPLVSFLAIFPVIFASMLTESSLVYLISGTVIRSFRSHGEGWITLYVLSFLLFLFASLGAGLVEWGMQLEGTGLVFLCATAAVLFVFLLILYFRLLGRLMWYTQNVPRKAVEN